MDRKIGLSQAPAQLPTERGEYRYCNVGTLRLQCLEALLAQGPGRQIIVGGNGCRAWSLVQQRQFAEHTSRRKGCKADVAALRDQTDAGAPARDQKQVRSRISCFENRATGGPFRALKMRMQPPDL